MSPGARVDGLEETRSRSPFDAGTGPASSIAPVLATTPRDVALARTLASLCRRSGAEQGQHGQVCLGQRRYGTKDGAKTMEPNKGAVVEWSG
jgi:hypothetical protein